MDYRFSVVMAVYNTERYLREAVESLIAQDIGFDRIQLILVDDGSRDGSGAICDEYAARYPDNVLALHQENAGVSAARNAGIEHARGRYVNFMDSDDRMSPNTFSLVWDFFEANRERTDLVSVPIVFFDGRTGAHILNDKFAKGSRVIDLRQEWATAQLSGASFFVRGECLAKLRFRTELKIAEDAQLIQRILTQKQTLGVVAEGEYQYRYRSDGQLSAIQSCQSNPAWYWPRLRYWLEDTVDFCRSTLGEVPRFIQYTLLYDMQWIVRMRQFPPGVLTPEEEPAFLARLYGLLSAIEDEVICALRKLPPEFKAFLLGKKHGVPPQLALTQNGFCFLCGREPLGSFAHDKIRIDTLDLEKERCTIEAHTALLPDTDCRVFAELDGTHVPVEIVHSESSRIFGEESLIKLFFRVMIPLTGPEERRSLRFGVQLQDKRAFPPCSFSPSLPVSAHYQHSYCCQAGRCVEYINGTVYFSETRTGTALRKELRYLWELLFGKVRNRRFALRRIVYWLGLSRKL